MMTSTKGDSPELELGVSQSVAQIHGRLRRYLEAQYHVRDSSLIEERLRLLDEPGAISQRPYIEVTPAYEVEGGYDRLRLPDAMRELLVDLASWRPGVGVYPPYVHQAQALQAFFSDGDDGDDLVVATGTGSGKTETFLYALLGMMAVEATSRPASFQMPGVRALLLYPMNALVSDQTARLRRMLGDERLAAELRSRWKRHVTFGMYTSRTPYPGIRSGSRDQRHVAPILRYYDALESSTDPNDQSLVRELRDRGRWPAKNVPAFFGRDLEEKKPYLKGKRAEEKKEYVRRHWSQRLLTQPGDRELLTRDEMQRRAPDLLVTNYSMLEYTLLRPLERSIYQQTQRWLECDARNRLVLILDEAHMYRGVGGAEVGLLIRRLQSRLGIGRERLRCILTSASISSAEKDNVTVQAFANGLCGERRGKSFAVVTGTRERRPDPTPGNEAQARALSAVSAAALAAAKIDRRSAQETIERVAKELDWKQVPTFEATEQQLRQYVGERLRGVGPLEILIALCSANGTDFLELTKSLFPAVEPTLAEQATNGLLALGTFARRSERGREEQPLVPTRVHVMFRGLPAVFACIDPTCPGRRYQGSLPSLVGRVVTEPATSCAWCGARVFEVFTHRDCGTAFLRVFASEPRAQFYWHDRGGRLSTVGRPLHEVHVLIETPHPRGAKDIEPIWIDLRTGRVSRQEPERQNEARLCFRPSERAEGDVTTFSRCPVCLRRTRPGGGKSGLKIMDLATKGEQPFANLIREQFVTQVLTRARSEQHPNGGRKALLFSDGRQKAARLARDLPREVERDSFRETIVVAVADLERLKIEATLDKTLYAGFVAACARYHLHFFDRRDQECLIEDINRFQKDYIGDLELALAEPWPTDPPVRYRQALLRQVSDPYYSLVAACAAIVEPRASRMKLLERRQPTIPSATLKQVAGAFINEMLRRNAFDQALRLEARQDVGFFDPLKETGLKRFFDDVSRRGKLNDDASTSLRNDLFEVLTVLGPDESGRLLNPEVLRLRIAVDDTWYQCRLCAHLQHSPLFDACGNCGEPALEARPPDHGYMEARKDYFRKPIRDALAGEPPVHLTAEEHTAQLAQRDTGDVYATTEEFELRFQDVPLGPKKPPVDVLSCTTTMEVGIDIGSLTAVGMRTMPPQRENYQQRAGRAGRRGSAVSTVLTYAQGGAHDAHYFDRPREIISGKPRDPKIKSDNRRLAVRHIHSFLLQTFFHRQMDDLESEEYEQLRRARPNLMSAFGDAVDFFDGDTDFSLVAFDRWIDREVLRPESALVREMLAWLPPELARSTSDPAELDTFVRDTTLRLVTKLRSLRPGLDEIAVTEEAVEAERIPENQDDEEEDTDERDNRTLLDLLFDAGVLPSYAFPTDLCSFVIQEEDDYDVAVKERPQLSKSQALSEYAPGRLLVVNKETYRVGGVFVGGHPTASPATILFQTPLTRYVGCDACNFVRLETGEVATIDKTPCPICDVPLRVREILDPPGFSPEEGLPVREGDRDQEITYASSAQLPELIERDKFEWRSTIGTHLRHAHGEEVQLVVANKGSDKDNEGFVVCESCGAAWLFGDEPEDGRHRRPFLLPKSVRIKERPPAMCTGPLNRGLFLAHQFRTDILLLRIALRHPIDGDPSKPWLRDGLATLAEALALGASLHLDIDPGDLSAGYRFTVDVDRQRCAEIYLFDTASGGAGYAADAGEELELVLERTRDLLLRCPAECERSCTRCLRHYGNRFLHPHMDRHLAGQLLEFAMTGRLPIIDDVARQARLLAPLAQWLRLEGWDIGSDRDAALYARPSQGATHIPIGVYPALIDQDQARALHPLNARADAVVLPDFVVSRDLPAAYQLLSGPRARAAVRLNGFPVRAWGETTNSDAVINLDVDATPNCYAVRVPFDAFAQLGIERGDWLVVRPVDEPLLPTHRVLIRRRSGPFGVTSNEWTVGYLKRMTDQHTDRGQVSYARPERQFRPERFVWSELEVVGIVVGAAMTPPEN